MSPEELLGLNIDKWGNLTSVDWKGLVHLEQINIQRSKNSSGEQILIYKVGENTLNLHSSENALTEAKQWFASLDMRNSTVIYVYGVGLGYAYKAAMEWLKKNEEHSIIFLEDNLEVIKEFLKTETASQLLDDPQAWLEYIDWQDIDNFCGDLTLPFSMQKYFFAFLNAYTELFPVRAFTIKLKTAFCSAINSLFIGEVLSFGQLYYKNFLKNALNLPGSFLGSHLYEKFNGMPAIVCGAGPSLEKNLKILETLSDKFLIFAGSTALNAVNANGFVPHFGVGLDPNITHKDRIVANTAYEIPFLYRPRINHNALEAVHGDLIYITGAAGYPFVDWFDKELSIESREVNEGYNVVNFSLSLAAEMGCSPIILVGVDLAYSNDQSYAPGLMVHPTQSNRFFGTKSTADELITMQDIHGNPVSTMWKWIAESEWYGKVTKGKILALNATEGGIGMPGIPNISLEEVAKNLPVESFDYHLKVHGETQNSLMPTTVTYENIRDLFKDIYRSLENCRNYCQQIVKETNSGNRNAIYEKLEEETAFKHILKNLNENILEYNHRHSLNLKKIKDMKLKDDKTNALNEKRYNLLAKASELLLSLFKDASENTSPGLVPLTNYKADEQYISKEEVLESDQKGILTINEPELGLNLKVEYLTTNESNGNGKRVLAYPSGNVKMEMFYKNHQLHGPVLFYKDNGSVLGYSFYDNGIKQGSSQYYYFNGRLHSSRKYLNGLKEGKEEYFYIDGTLKSQFGYKQGKLHGPAKLLYPDGSLKRELHFINGKKHGSEKFWDQKGILIAEMEYEYDRPIGNVTTWYSNGQIAQEIIYNKDGVPVTIKKWDESGEEPQQEGQADFFDLLAKQANVLTQSLDNVTDHLHKIAPMLMPDGIKKYELEENFKNINSALHKLHDLSDGLMHESGTKICSTKETTWKTPSIQIEMEKRLEDMTDKLKKELENLQKTIDSGQNKTNNKEEKNEQ